MSNLRMAGNRSSHCQLCPLPSFTPCIDFISVPRTFSKLGLWDLETVILQKGIFKTKFPVQEKSR